MSMCGHQSRCIVIHLLLVSLIILSSSTRGYSRPQGAVRSSCKTSDLNDLRGEIKSPNYPLNYSNNDACKWHIKLTNSQMVTLSFLHFQLEGGKSCLMTDSLSLNPGQLLYCGSTLPPPYISPQNTPTVTIAFKSDAQNTFQGFLIDYFVGERQPDSCNVESLFQCSVGNCIPLEWKCNGQSECSDNSDESYQLCQKDATTPQSVTCPPHDIRCASPDTGEPFCLPESKKCDGHRDCLNGEDEDGCASVCENVLDGVSGKLSSPNFPFNYDNNLNCYWILSVAAGEIIQLRFDVFDLEQRYNTDFVGVYDGVDFSNEIGHYYAFSPDVHVPPKVIEGGANQLKVTFYTDSSSTSKGFNATYQTKGVCLPGQTLCSSTDKNCFAPNQACDNSMACIMGQDEVGCSSTCPEMIACFKSTSGCFTMSSRCNGINDCVYGEDEADCVASVCNHDKGLFLCGKNACIQERHVCDSTANCEEGLDEKNCYLSTNVITAAAVGSMVCSLLLLAALTCTCKLYQLHVRDRLPPTHISPLREIEDELLRREAPPSYTATMASPHFDEAQRSFIEGIQAAVIARNESRTANRQGSTRRQRGTFVRMLSRDRQLRAGGQVQAEPDDSATAEDPLPELPSSSTPPSSLSTIPEPDGGHFDAAQVSTGGAQSDPMPTLQRISDEPDERGISLNSADESSIHPDTGSSSISISDTDSETNIDALRLADRDHQILRAAANIRRMRLAGGLQNVMQAQDHRAARSRSRAGSLADITNPTADAAPSGMGSGHSESAAVAGAASQSPNQNANNPNANSRSEDSGETPVETSAKDTEPEREQPQEVLDAGCGASQADPLQQTAESESNGAEHNDRETAEQTEEDTELGDSRLRRSSSALSLISTRSAASVESGANDVPMLIP